MAQRGVKQTRIGRAEQLEFLVATFESASDGVLVVDSSGRLVSLNEAGRGIAGHPKLTGGGFLSFPPVLNLHYLDGRAMPANESPLGRALRGLPEADPLALLRKPGGAEVIISSSSIPVRDHTGAIVGAVSIFRDVTSERRTEEAQADLLALITEANERLTMATLRAQEAVKTAERRAAELQATLDNMVEGVLVANTEGRITLVNEAAIWMLGLRSGDEATVEIEELESRLRARGSTGAKRGPSCRSLARALAGEATITEESVFRNPTTGRETYLLTNATPIRGRSGEILGAVTVTRDVTDLTEIDRLKEQFIAVAAHELKTPVTIMKGFAQLLMRDPEGLSIQQRKGLEAIALGADRIHRIVRDLLDISLLSSAETAFIRARVDLAELVEQTWDGISIAQPDHELLITGSGRVSVVADRLRLAQVIENLLDNAVRYSPDGGTIEVDVSSSGDRAVVSVTDHGVGIPADKQSGIFQRFFRAHNGTPHDYGGMGVGLHISREIILRHGGTMDFESREGEGSTFRFSVPTCEADPAGK